MDVTSWAPLLAEVPNDGHVALVYRDHDFLARAVAVWTAPALRAGGGAVLVGTANHAVSIRAQLALAGIDVAGAERVGRLVFVDADWLMGHFILDGTPDGARFRPLADEIITSVRRATGSAEAPMRAWGEMVSLLRLRGNPAGARRLEELWTDVIEAHSIPLLCSYDIEGRLSEDDVAFHRSVAHAHDRLILQAEPPARGVVVGPIG